MNKKRELYFFKGYFEKFYDSQTKKNQKKTLWTLRIIEVVPNTEKRESNKQNEKKIIIGSHRAFYTFGFCQHTNQPKKPKE